MANRRIPAEVQEIFDRYSKNFGRRLKKQDAVEMLKTEFGLKEDQASDMFDSFDRDKNGIMSIWEFQACYTAIGNNASKMVEKFEELDQDKSGKLDAEEAKAGLKDIMMGDRSLNEKEIDFFIKSSVGDDGLIDLGEFANLLLKLKMYEKKTATTKK